MDNKMDARTQPLKSIIATPEQALPMDTLTSSFEAGAAQRADDGLEVTLWLPPGVHGDDGPLEAVIAGSMVGEKQAEVAAVFERTEHNRPTEPHWYLSPIGVEVLHRNKGCGAALLEYRLRQCDREHLPAYLWSSNPLNTSLYERHGFEIAARFEWVRRLPSFPCCAVRAEELAHKRRTIMS
jgi:ribosomal protein S18 acetylase RimI-like enzyme